MMIHTMTQNMTNMIVAQHQNTANAIGKVFDAVTTCQSQLNTVQVQLYALEAKVDNFMCHTQQMAGESQQLTTMVAGLQKAGATIENLIKKQQATSAAWELIPIDGGMPEPGSAGSSSSA